MGMTAQRGAAPTGSPISCCRKNNNYPVTSVSEKGPEGFRLPRRARSAPTPEKSHCHLDHNIHDMGIVLLVTIISDRV